MQNGSLIVHSQYAIAWSQMARHIMIPLEIALLFINYSSLYHIKALEMQLQ